MSLKMRIRYVPTYVDNLCYCVQYDYMPWWLNNWNAIFHTKLPDGIEDRLGMTFDEWLAKPFDRFAIEEQAIIFAKEWYDARLEIDKVENAKAAERQREFKRRGKARTVWTWP